MNYGCSIAIEQRTGTRVPLPGETPAVRQKHAGNVVDIYEIPHYEFELPVGLQSRTFMISITFPYVNFVTQISTLLSTIFGNISMMGRLKLLDLHFPRSFVR